MDAKEVKEFHFSNQNRLEKLKKTFSEFVNVTSRINVSIYYYISFSLLCIFNKFFILEKRLHNSIISPNGSSKNSNALYANGNGDFLHVSKIIN